MKTVNYEWVDKHTDLLEAMLALELSKSTMLRIIDVVNEIEDPSACMAKTDEFTALLKSCETEEEVLAKLDEAGI